VLDEGLDENAKGMRRGVGTHAASEGLAAEGLEDDDEEPDEEADEEPDVKSDKTLDEELDDK